MKRTLTLLLLIAFVSPNVCTLQAQQTADSKPTPEKSTEQFLSEVDKSLPQLLKDFSVPGAAIGIIENGEIVLQKGYGYSDLEKQVKVDEKTGFNIASISKTIAAWGVMKLVQEGKIDLDAPAEKYLTRWHLPESEFDANEVTIRRLLSHTAGLSLHGYPGWSPKDKLPTIEESLNGKNNGPGRVEIIMKPGTKYKYSGGGFSILQLIIEEVTGQKFEDYMQTQILNPLGMNNSSYKIDDKIMAASSSEHDNFGDVVDFELFTAQAAAGLHTTIEDFTRFAVASLYQSKDFKKHNTVLPSETLKQMMKPVPQAEGRYGYALGYSTESIPGTSVALRGHGGANTGWHSFLKVNPETNDGFIMVTNGGAGQRVYYHIFSDWVLWQTGTQLEDWHRAKPSIANRLKSTIDSNDTVDIAVMYNELKANEAENYDFSESQLNELGYHYLAKDNVKKAIAILKLNVEAFPGAFNTYDSLGEAFLKQGARAKAIENYKKSVELNPGNVDGIKILNDLGVSTDDLVVKVSTGHLNLLAGEYLATNQPADMEGEWKIVFEEVNGELVGNDRGYRYKLNPVGDDEFVNPDDGASLVFNSKDKDAITLLLFGKIKFKKTAALAPPTANTDSKAAPDKPDVDPYFVESSGISSKTGPQVITRNILQDSKGGFWLATWNGIMRYDGTTFTNVTNEEGLRRYRAFSLLEDHEKNIWVGTVGGAGVYRYDGKTFTNFTTKDGLVHNSTVAMMQDYDRNIWIGSMGVTKYDGKTFTTFTKKDGFTDSDVNSISQGSFGDIWFGTRGALFHYDGKTFVNFTEKHGLNFPGYVPTVIDRKGHLWFGGENGVYYFDGKTVQHVFKSPSYSLFEDSHGNIWFSGGALKGEKNPKPGTSVLNRFDPKAGLENILTAREQLEVNNGQIFGLTEDKEGNLWICTGRGIDRIDADIVQFYSSTLVRQAQEALIARGYNIGTASADNIMGSYTRVALAKFQKDNNLAVGRLDLETLKKLGIKK